MNKSLEHGFNGSFSIYTFELDYCRMKFRTLLFRTLFLLALSIATAGTAVVSASRYETYNIGYVVTDDNHMLQVLRPVGNDDSDCERIDGDAITPELLDRTGGLLNGWAFVHGDNSQGYVTWVSEKSGVHTVFLANYVLRNCALSEIRYGQRTFVGDDRYEEARRAYTDLIRETLTLGT